MESNSENNMKVINKEYDRLLTNPSNIIMSEELQDLMGVQFGENELNEDFSMGLGSADSHSLSICNTADPADEVIVHSSLCNIQYESDYISVGVELASEVPQLLQKLTYFTQHEMREATSCRLILKGQNGFTASSCVVDSWSLMKTAPHNFLLTIKFRSKNVIFR